MKTKTSVSLISYLNSKPFLYGLQNHRMPETIDLQLEIPAQTVEKLANKRADIGLVPVGGLCDLDNYEIISNYCIGATGKVRTVVLASEVPVEKIETVLLDYQSRSSVMLCKVLAKHYWRKDFLWQNTTGNFHNHLINNNTAGVVIGDRVFDIEKRYRYCYDLSEEWLEFTGLPFVFAVWVALKKPAADFTAEFNAALAYGVNNLKEVAQTVKGKYPGVDINDYFTNNISYPLDEEKQKGMAKFMKLAQKQACR